MKIGIQAVFQSLPTFVLQLPSTRQPNFVLKVKRIPWSPTQVCESDGFQHPHEEREQLLFSSVFFFFFL